jgi:uncharacterized protein (DUF305 family)
MSGHRRGHAGPATHSASASKDGFATAMGHAMDEMMRAMHAAPPSGDPDRDFLAMMIPHHQGAIDMAVLVLRYGRDPLVRQLAESIVASQSVEIAAMHGRLEHLTAGTSTEPFPEPTGTRGPG